MARGGGICLEQGCIGGGGGGGATQSLSSFPRLPPPTAFVTGSSCSALFSQTSGLLTAQEQPRAGSVPFR